MVLIIFERTDLKLLADIKKRTLLSFVLFFAICVSYAQEQKTLSATFRQTPLNNVVDSLESAFDIKFFYKEEWLTNKTVNTELNSLDVVNAIKKVLEGQNFKFLKRQNKVILLLDDGAQDEIVTLDAQPGKAITIGSIDMLAESATLSGFILDGEYGSPLQGAIVSVKNSGIREVTSNSGYYEITLPTGNHEINFHHPTMEDFDISITLNSSGKLNVKMYEDVLRLSEVVISEKALDNNVSETITGQETISVETIKTLPAFFGEADVFNSVLTLPGVSRVGEGSSGLNIRGGGVGQNLIRMDNAIIYNSAHLFGFFSAFNADAVQKVNFYKGSIPVQYGGRLSSVLDVEVRNGDKQKFTGSGGVGFINSRFTLEGPIEKDTTSFLASFRAAYPTYIIRSIEDEDLKRSSAFFGDANFKVDHLFNATNRIAVSGYLSKDRFRFSNQAEYDYGNTSADVEYNARLGANNFLKANVDFSKYDYQLSEVENPQLSSSLSASIQDISSTFEFEYENENHKITYGASYKYLTIEPGNYKPLGEQSIVNPLTIASEQGSEGSVFVADEFSINNQLSVYGGLRYSFFNGGKNDLQAFYHGAEPRFSLNYRFSSNSSVKIGYHRMRQYVQLISNTTSVTPIDLWKLSNENITPSIADQGSIGYFRNFKNNMFETSVEFYYKSTKDLVEYRNGADLFLNPSVESEIVQGQGSAYGAELLIRKNKGEFTGWLSYTYSRALIQVNGNTTDERINRGEYFPTNFDQPHSLNLFSKWQVTRRFGINTNFTFNTGRPITYPESTYSINGISVANYSDRNKYRIPDYHRLDISFVLATSLKRNKKVEANWSLSIYNLYGRRNAYSVYFKKDPVTSQLKAYKLSVIGRPIVALSYNFKF